MNIFDERESYKKWIYFIKTNIKDKYPIIIILAQNFKKIENNKPILQYIINLVKKCIKNAKEYNMSQYDINVYMKGVTIKNVDVNLFKALTELLQKLFPEKLHKCNIIDPPPIFKIVYTIIKTFIDKRTKKKIKIVNSKKNKSIIKI